MSSNSTRPRAPGCKFVVDRSEMARLRATPAALRGTAVVLAFTASCGRSNVELYPFSSAGGAPGAGGMQAAAGRSAVGGASSAGAAGAAVGVAGVGGSDGGAPSAGGRAGATGGGVGGRGGRGGRSAGSAGASGNSGTGGIGGSGGSSGGGFAGTTGGVGASGEGGAGGESGAPRKAVKLALGAFHACAVFDDGSLRCWGTRGYIGSGNALTIGDDEPASVAPDVDIGGKVVDIAAGWYHTCAVLENGAVRCFGVANDGRLGYGNAEDIGDDETPASAGDVDLGGSATQIAAGPQHTCARLASGAVRCWGKNEDYQLGHPGTATIGDDESPAAAGDVDLGAPARQVVVGFGHSCALLDGGKVRCWGNGSGGRLGYGNQNTIGDDETPAAAGDVDLGGEAVALAGGSFHTCALLTTGNVRCWGYGPRGELGYANQAAVGDDETPAQAGDVDVGGAVLAIAAGDYATCAVLVGGSVRCWGSGEQGELGTGNVTDIGDNETPASAAIDLGGLATQVDVGFLNVCATLENGAVRCWGRGDTGELGHGNIDDIGDDETPAAAGDVPVVP